jgi:hypothetical protein
MTRLKYLLVVAVLVLSCLADFLTYLVPRASQPLALTALAGALPCLSFS